MLTIAIEDLEMRQHNTNLFLEKNIIWFKPLTQKKEINKQIANTLYYKY